MTETRIEGRAFELRFDMYAMEMVEEEFGGIRELFQELQGGKQVKALKSIFRIMGNSALTFRGEPEKITGNEILRLTVAEMRQLTRDIQAEIRKSMKKETADGNEADDEVHDLYEDEESEKNG